MLSLFSGKLGCLLVVGAIAGISAASAAGPTREATCVNTTIASIGHRLQSGPGGPIIPDSGSAVRFTNGVYQVGYDELPQVTTSRVGDHVTLCLIRIPRGCPAGDDRGRVYTATNLRTMQSWTMADAEHACGGA